MPNGAASGPTPNATANNSSSFAANNGRVVQANGVRILCVADVRGRSFFSNGATPPTDMSLLLAGNLKSLNDLAKQARADYIIHTGDFGFYDDSSLDRIADKYV